MKQFGEGKDLNYELLINCLPNIKLNSLENIKANEYKIKIEKKIIEDKLKEFNEVIETAFNLTEKKRFYISDYGYGNVREVINGEQSKLVKGQNWDKFYLENITAWWKKKASKRYEKLKQENRFRDRVELWTDEEDIQIIR